MKKTIKILMVIIISAGFNACDQAEELLNINLPATISKNIPVKVNQTNGSWANYSNSIVISLNTGDISEYINKIKDVKVKKLSYKIINFSGDNAGQVKGSFIVDNIIDMQNEFVVKTSADNGTLYSVTNPDELKELGELLRKNRSFTAKYSGGALCDDAGMDFIIEVTIVLNVTANPI